MKHPCTEQGVPSFTLLPSGTSPRLLSLHVSQPNVSSSSSSTTRTRRRRTDDCDDDCTHDRQEGDETPQIQEEATPRRRVKLAPPPSPSRDRRTLGDRISPMARVNRRLEFAEAEEPPDTALHLPPTDVLDSPFRATFYSLAHRSQSHETRLVPRTLVFVNQDDDAASTR